MIHIRKSSTADTRTCDWSKVTKDQLYSASQSHKSDVVQGMQFFKGLMADAMLRHDDDKLNDIDGFHRDFSTGFTQTVWWDNHRKITRHHLTSDDGVPEDVNLIDVLEMVVDGVMAGMARSGSVYPPKISSNVLLRAVKNTSELLVSQIVVEG